MFWVYVMENPQGRFYSGHTDDLSRRVANHNRTDKTAGKFTRQHGPWALAWSEAHPTRALAMSSRKANQAHEVAPLDARGSAQR